MQVFMCFADKYADWCCAEHCKEDGTIDANDSLWAKISSYWVSACLPTIIMESATFACFAVATIVAIWYA